MYVPSSFNPGGCVFCCVISGKVSHDTLASGEIQTSVALEATLILWPSCDSSDSDKYILKKLAGSGILNGSVRLSDTK